MQSKSIIDLIGNTPLIKINNIIKNKKINLYAKLEGQNPSGSIKDRIAKEMIEKAIKEKKLNKNKVLIEASSGNTGISLAMLSAVLNYKTEIVMSKSASIERKKIIKAFGAKIILSSEKEGTAGAINKLKEKLKKNPNKYFYTNQHNNKNNWLTHFKNTGPEIWEQSKGKLDYLIVSMGTTGTIMGIGKYLKRKNKNIKIISIEPILGEKIEGIRNLNEQNSPKDFNIYDPKYIDQIIQISRAKALKTTKEIIKNEGILVGQSSGAALAGVLKFTKKIKKGNIVTIFPDRGEKYLSTELFNI